MSHSAHQSTMTSTPSLEPQALPGSYEARVQEAALLIQQGELDQAAAICQRIVERIGRVPERRRIHDTLLYFARMEAFILLTKIYSQQGNWTAVDELCAQGQALHPEYADRWLVEPHTLRVQHGQTQEGVRGLQAQAEARPDSFFLWSMLAQTALEAQDLAAAQMASDHAETLIGQADDEEEIGSFYVNRSLICQYLGQWYDAERAWLTGCVFDSALEEMREMVIRMYLSAGLYDDALRLADDESMSAVGADYYRAWIANQRGDRVRARHLWRKVAEADQGDKGERNVARGLAYCWLRQEDQALGLLLASMTDVGGLGISEALTLALAWAMHGDGQAALTNVQLAASYRSRRSGHKRLLSALDWVEFEQLVEDEGIKAELRPYFEASAPIEIGA